MSQIIDAPLGFNPQPHLEKAFREISNYTAIFILEDGRVGSGTFVNSGGVDGILTAHHVAKPVLEGQHFALNISNHEHALWRRSQDFEHIPIGHPQGGRYTDAGPDLSFIVIRDAQLLGILRSLKSFCFLESQKVSYFAYPLERQYWAVAGSPHEWKAIVKPASATEGPVAAMKNWVGWVYFESRMERDGFDFVRLRATSGVNNYPADYEGVSGGGLWLVPMEVDHDENPTTISHGKPVLAGVAFYQSEPHDYERIVTGHGFHSIYHRVKEVLPTRGRSPSPSSRTRRSRSER